MYTIEGLQILPSVYLYSVFRAGITMRRFPCMSTGYVLHTPNPECTLSGGLHHQLPSQFNQIDMRAIAPQGLICIPSVLIEDSVDVSMRVGWWLAYHSPK